MAYRRNNSALGDAILQDINRWSNEKQDKLNKAAKKIQDQMFRELSEGDATPVRNYPHNNGTVMRIVVHRGGGVKKAVREKAEHQPGDIKAGWAKVTFKQKNGARIFGVRNKAYPKLIHLINFDHDVVSWGEDTGKTAKGSKFVTKVQEKGQQKLDEEIKKILNE